MTQLAFERCAVQDVFVVLFGVCNACSRMAYGYASDRFSHVFSRASFLAVRVGSGVVGTAAARVAVGVRATWRRCRCSSCRWRRFSCRSAAGRGSTLVCVCVCVILCSRTLVVVPQ